MVTKWDRIEYHDRGPDERGRRHFTIYGMGVKAYDQNGEPDNSGIPRRVAQGFNSTRWEEFERKIKS